MKATLLPIAFATLCGCGRVVDGTKDALNKGGELAGSAATEVIEGVTTGVQQTWSVEVQLSDTLKAKGLTVGKTLVESDSAGNDNVLVIYFGSDRALNDTLHAVAEDEEGREMGRSSSPVALDAGAADYFTFRFQARTDLERKSRISIR